VDESGLNSAGTAQYRDKLSWCVNPENVALDICNSIVVNDVFRSDDEVGIERKRRLYHACFNAFSDSRTLVDDEAEAHTVGEYAAENTRRMCRCDGEPFQQTDLGDFGTELYDSSIVPGFCVCRSLARTTRVVVGPDALYDQAEGNIEAPEFLKAPSYEFPLCKCGDADPCLIRRTCARGQLGNDNHPVGNLDEPVLAQTLANVAEFKFTPTAVQLVGRKSTYAQWELYRLKACTDRRMADCTDQSVFPIAAATGERPAPGFESIGVRNQRFILVPSTCSGTFKTTDALYPVLWGDCIVSLKKTDFVCGFVVKKCTSLPNLLKSLGASVQNDTLAMETDFYQSQFTRAIMGRMASSPPCAHKRCRVLTLTRRPTVSSTCTTKLMISTRSLASCASVMEPHLASR